jgi:Leucine-rich repeat (LRR) protein
MPTEGKAPLTEVQRDILEWWIEKGALASMPLAKTPPDDRMREVLTDYFQLNGDPLLDLNPEPASDGDVEALRSKGFQVSRISSGGVWLDIKYTGSVKPDLSVLSRVREQLVWLQLSHCGLTDEDMEEIAALDNLFRLNLSQNEIGDQGIAELEGLKSLEQLNIYGTRVTNKSLQMLSGLPSLKKLFIWDCQIDSTSAVAAARPGLEIVHQVR